VPLSRLLERDYRAFTLGIVAVMTMFAFEGIGVATAMPSVAGALDGLNSYAWAFNGYLVSSLVAMVIAGEWNDRAGPRLPLMTGAILFGLGAVIAGSSVTMPMLVFARVIQGLGGGLAVVSVYVVLGRAYPDELRPRAFTLLSAAWVLPSIVGPFVAGFLTDHVTWRAVFWLVIPFSFSVLLMSSRLGHLGGGSTEHPLRWNRLVFAFAAAGSLAVLQEAGSRRDVLGAALAVIGLLVLVPTLSRLLPDGALRFAHGLPTVVMMRGVLAGSFFAGEAFLPLAVHTVRGASTAEGGLLLTIGALGWTVGSQLQGRLYPRVQRRQLVQSGAALVAFCLCVLPVAMMSSVSFWVAALPWLVGALGMGMAFGAIGTLTLELSGPNDQGANSAALQVLDSTGSIVFIGIAGVIYGSALARGVVSGWTFTWIWWVMAAVALGGSIVSRRIPTTSVAIATD